MPSGSIFIFCSHVIRVSALQIFLNKRLYTLYIGCCCWLLPRNLHCRQRIHFLKCGVALIIPGGYCSRVALCSWHVRGLGTFLCNNCISISPPLARKDGTPLCQVWLIGGRKRRVAQSGNLHWCSSCYKFVSGGLGTRVPSISVNGQPIPFPCPLAGSCFKSSSDRSCSSCRDISQQGLQASLARELVTGDPMACSIVGHPCKHPSGIVTHRQIWQLSPRLKHGRVESID